MRTLATALLTAAVMLASAAAPAQTVAFHRDPTRGILVTGAASGIGRATALRFRAAGYTVYATDRDTTRWGDLAAAGCETLYLDVTDEASIVAAREAIEAGGGRVDILVNNAGYGQNGVIEELTLDDLRRQFEVNVFGLIRVTQEFVPAMRARGRGRIVNIGSVGGDFTSPGASAYQASKYALESFSDGMRQELGRFGIDVALVKPGGVDTEFTEHAAPTTRRPWRTAPTSSSGRAFSR